MSKDGKIGNGEGQSEESISEEAAMDLERKEDIVTTFNVPKSLLTELGHIAVEEGVSKAEVIRRAIKEYVSNKKSPPTISRISDTDLNEILDSCTQEEGASFEIDGEDGLIEQMKARGFRLKDLTEKQWKTLQPRLQIGYGGYFSKPTPLPTFFLYSLF